MYDYKIIGRKIYMLRREKHIKQHKLAEMIDKSPSYLCDIEKGRIRPSLKVIFMIADKLDIDVWKLFV